MDIKFKNTPKILGLDISTKTTGLALFDLESSELLELTHFSPKIKPEPEDRLELLMKKADGFKERLLEYKSMNIVEVIIEEPLLNSNNIYTVGTLLRYNTLICRLIYEILNITPKFISTYDARSFGFPNLVRENNKGKKVLFGGYPADIDKKLLIWQEVNSLYPNIKWIYNKKGELKKENFDMSDAATAVIGYINRSKII